MVNDNGPPEPSWHPWHDEEPIRIGVSSCLLGAEVRYDGGHKRDRYIAEVLCEFFEWVPVCPEVEIGLGVPRPPIRLLKGQAAPRLVEPDSGEDLTERMESFARKRLAELQEAGLDGFILKSRSPSCGMEGVEVLGAGRSSTKDGAGIFARVLMEGWADLPVAEEGWLGEPHLCGDFVERVLRHHRGRITALLDLDPGRLTDLRANHQLLLERLRVKG